MTQTRPPQRDQQVILQSYVAAQRRLVGDGAIVIRVPGRESMGLSTLGRIVPAPANVLGLIQVRPPPATLWPGRVLAVSPGICVALSSKSCTVVAADDLYRIMSFRCTIDCVM